MPKPKPQLSTTDWAVLGVLAEGPTHGFRLAGLFASSGELGDIWKIQRPQVYRALEHLERHGLAHPIGQESGAAGPPRTLYAITPQGQTLLDGWLQTPVERLRYGRSDLRLKLAFWWRKQQRPEAFLQAQAQVFSTLLAQLEARLPHAQGLERVSVLWRLEMAQASLRFVQSL